MNLLLQKKALENWVYPEIMTNGNIKEYNGTSGFSYTFWPDTLTFDLDSVIKIKCIRFLLWDNMGYESEARATRKYRYRLLTSIDGNTWFVHFYACKEGYNGWQQFIFEEEIDVKFIKIDALHNTANGEFHIVEIQAFDSMPPSLNTEITVNKTFKTITNNIEIGDGFPITNKVINLAKRLKNLISQNSELVSIPGLNKIVEDLQVQSKDINLIEGNMESIKRSILDPVEKELKAGSKLGKYSKYGFLVGLISIILSIITMIISFSTKSC